MLGEGPDRVWSERRLCMCYGGGSAGGPCLTAMPRIQPGQVQERYHVIATDSTTSPMTTPDPQFWRAAWRGTGNFW